MMTSFQTKQKEGNTGARQSGGCFFSSVIQPKLNINEPSDEYEQEADATADKVMRMPESTMNDNFFKPAITSVQRKCSHCEAEEKLQRKEENNARTTHSDDLDSYVEGLSNSGQPLSDKDRSFFEPKFGYNFSNVRLHTDSVAAKSAQSINALAYTSGNNIVFNNGQYSPDTDTGKRLLGHELTHVVQQRSLNGSVARLIQRQEEEKLVCDEEKNACWPEDEVVASITQPPDEESQMIGPPLPDNYQVPSGSSNQGAGGISSQVAENEGQGNKGGEGYTPPEPVEETQNQGNGGNRGYVVSENEGNGGNKGYVVSENEGQGNKGGEGYTPPEPVEETKNQGSGGNKGSADKVCDISCLGPKQDAVDTAFDTLRAAQRDYELTKKWSYRGCFAAVGGLAIKAGVPAFKNAISGSRLGPWGALGGGALGAITGGAPAAVPTILACGVAYAAIDKAENTLINAKNNYDRQLTALNRDCCK